MTDLIDYLSRHFLSEAQLLATAGIDAAILQDLQARRMAPLPAYRLRLAVHCDSFFGPHEEAHALRFYATGTPAWLAAVANLAGEQAAFELFARRHQARLHELAPDAGADVAAAWASFLDGTYGLCTRSGLPEEIAAKEWAAGTIEAIIAQGVADAADEHELTTLRHAVDTLDAASNAFAPHERERSSRRRLVDGMREQYRL
ncbi:DUF6058 family natural product biosynthesis protein [Pseudoduganella buxea]|uniref:Uncharacterized protein n=1 Tax=Pseudoduganella buxea TaxID=1949069 RepID=A0A6I3SQL0_9BURK|nr:DUF6058 family natural product biosynthesis protein [Pseudoduganella buxea]MTV51364.1 hypothetical protein [Pseudoduganella buxea]GGC09671.1 hypothetical protein GCM10011572_33980 [Pseudoduganella buxea]